MKSLQIADQKGPESLKAFKYNEEKALKWLSLKCQKLANALRDSHFHIGAKSINYVKSEKNQDPSQNGTFKHTDNMLKDTGKHVKMNYE